MRKLSICAFMVVAFSFLGCDEDGEIISPCGKAECCIGDDCLVPECRGKLCSECDGKGCIVKDPTDCTGKPCSKCDGDGCIKDKDKAPICKDKPCSECDGDGCIKEQEQAPICKDKSCSECNGDGCIQEGGNPLETCTGDKCTPIINILTCEGLPCKTCSGDGCIKDCTGMKCSECTGDNCIPDVNCRGLNCSACKASGCVPDEKDCEGKHCSVCMGPGCIEGMDVNERLFCLKDNEMKIIDPAGYETCGATDCDSFNYGAEDCGIFWDNRTCQKLGESYACQCPDGFIECAGRCVDYKNDVNHCGEQCVNCDALGESAECMEGQCRLRRCATGSHPLLNNNMGEFTECEPNTATRCAPTYIRSDDAVIDCTKNIDGETVAEWGCSDEGTCIAVSCGKDYRLNESKTGCIPIECDDDQFSDGSRCLSYLTECEPGTHISEDRKTCVTNTRTLCAPPTGWPNKSNRYTDYVTKCKEDMVCGPEGKCTCKEGYVNNLEKNACVPATCLDHPGIQVAQEVNGFCQPTTCQSDFVLINQNGRAICAPICTCGCRCGKAVVASVSTSCLASGVTTISSIGNGYCYAETCSSNYVAWNGVCLPKDSCCGANCMNCKSKGLICGSNGLCQAK